MSIHPSGFHEIFFSFWRHRQLIAQMVKRGVLGRYRGSFFGLLWSFATPIMMLAVYTFVFSVVFQARWGAVAGSRVDFALVLFAGLIVFNLFAECISAAPTLILSNANYVKKIVFPLEILPWVTLGSALFHAGISLVVLLVALLLTGSSLTVSALLLPLIIAPLLLMIVGLCWLLASFGVFVRDVGQIVGMILTVLMFLSPIFFPVSALPEGVRSWLVLNPLAFVIEQARDVLIWGRYPNWSGLVIYSICALIFAWVGFFWFQKTRKGFADVI